MTYEKTIFTVLLTVMLLTYFTTASSALNINSDTLYVSLFKDKISYKYREPAHIYGRIYYGGEPTEGGVVAVQLENEGHTIALKTVPVGTPSGNWPVTITSVVPCDVQGKPKENFMRGEAFYVNVTVKNNNINEVNVTITITIFDIDLTPLKFAYLRTTVSPQSSLSWMPQVGILPEWCSIGPAQVAVSVLTDFPSSRGHPLCPGETGFFVITNGEDISSGASAHPYTEPTYYNVTYRIPPYPAPCSKTLNIYVGAYYNGMNAYASTTLPVNYQTVTDVVYDRIIDIYDIAAITILYSTKSTDELWDPIYDIVPSGEIDIYDVSYVTIQYGLSY